jgi:hypothetical protein
MDLDTLKAIALRTEVTLLIEGLQYELVSVNRNAMFETIATGA